MTNERHFTYSRCASELGVPKCAIAGKISRLRAAGVKLHTQPPPQVKRRMLRATGFTSQQTTQPRYLAMKRPDGTTTMVSKFSPVAKVLRTSKCSTLMHAAVDAIMALGESQCKYPVGEPMNADFHFCCAPVKDEEVYCDCHRLIAYGPWTPA